MTNFVYLIIGHYRDNAKLYAGCSKAFCFLTEKEAENYCSFHSNENKFFSYECIQIGRFKMPRKKK